MTSSCGQYDAQILTRGAVCGRGGQAELRLLNDLNAFTQMLFAQQFQRGVVECGGSGLACERHIFGGLRGGHAQADQLGKE